MIAEPELVNDTSNTPGQMDARVKHDGFFDCLWTFPIRRILLELIEHKLALVCLGHCLGCESAGSKTQSPEAACYGCWTRPRI